jgi:uncharacterized protein (TIGR03437 family)
MSGTSCGVGFRALSLGASLFLLSIPASSQLYLVKTLPVGHRPQGLVTLGSFNSYAPLSLAVANSGDGTVSIMTIQDDLSLGPPIVVPVPSPYNVTSCGRDPGSPPSRTGASCALVTSPSSNSLTTIKVNYSSGTVTATSVNTISVGPQPYSALYTAAGYLVSTLGDSALSLVDPASGSVQWRVPNVPGNSSPNGIIVTGNPPNLAWVAGTDANVVMVVNLAQAKVVATIPINQPISFGINNAQIPSMLYAIGGDARITFLDSASLQIMTNGSNQPAVIAGLASPVSASVFSGSDLFAVSGGSVVDTVYTGSPTAAGAFSAQAAFVVAGVSGAAQVSVGWCSDPSSCSNYYATLPGSDAVVSIIPLTGPYSLMSLTNAASYALWGPAGSHPLARAAPPGTLATAFTPSKPGVAQHWAATLPLPASLGGISVSVGGTATYTNSSWTYSSSGTVQAPLLYVGPTQVNFQMPPGTQGELVPVQISYPDGTTLLSSVRTGITDPGIFTLTSASNGPGAVLNQDNSVNSGSNPAARGSVVQIFATGAGATTPSLAAGVPAPASGSPLVFTQVQPTATIGGANAVVQFSGMAPGLVGVWQINAVVPQSVTPGGTVTLSISAGGIQSNQVSIAVK